MMRRLAFAAAFYFVWFAALTWPALAHFSTHFITDRGDGMTNIWNLWWMRKAIVDLGTSPLYTTYLHYPHGTTLIGHTLNPFNGLVTLPLLGLVSLTVAHNLMIVFSFVVGGLTAYALCRHVSGSHWGSLWGGFVFTFSSFHFAHAEGHMQMVALEWIPLFLLAWLHWLETPSVTRAVAAAGALVLVLLCDLYFTLFSVTAAALMTGWAITRARSGIATFVRVRLRSGLVFAALAGVTVGGFAQALVTANRRDPFIGAHASSAFGMDLLAPFIYGGHWRFAAWTASYWGRISGNIHESSLHLGWAVLAALAWCGWQRRRIERPGVGLWFTIAGVFAVLALGPTLRVWGRPIAWAPTPYAMLAAVLPPLKLSGAVSRWFVMTTLAAGVLIALAYPSLRAGPLRRSAAAFAVAALLVVEAWPKPLPLTRIPAPAWVRVVAATPGDGAVIDAAASRPLSLYYQTLYEKPMAFGYIARSPLSTLTKGHTIIAATRAVLRANDPSPAAAAELAALGFRHLVAKRAPTPVPFLRQQYADDDIIVYDLAPP